jgi:hypothetical protein
MLGYAVGGIPVPPILPEDPPFPPPGPVPDPDQPIPDGEPPPLEPEPPYRMHWSGRRPTDRLPIHY